MPEGQQLNELLYRIDKLISGLESGTSLSEVRLLLLYNSAERVFTLLDRAGEFESLVGREEFSGFSLTKPACREALRQSLINLRDWLETPEAQETSSVLRNPENLSALVTELQGREQLSQQADAASESWKAKFEAQLKRHNKQVLYHFEESLKRQLGPQAASPEIQRLLVPLTSEAGVSSFRSALTRYYQQARIEKPTTITREISPASPAVSEIMSRLGPVPDKTALSIQAAISGVYEKAVSERLLDLSEATIDRQASLAAVIESEPELQALAQQMALQLQTAGKPGARLSGAEAYERAMEVVTQALITYQDALSEHRGLLTTAERSSEAQQTILTATARLCNDIGVSNISVVNNLIQKTGSHLGFSQVLKINKDWQERLQIIRERLGGQKVLPQVLQPWFGRLWSPFESLFFSINQGISTIARPTGSAGGGFLNAAMNRIMGLPNALADLRLFGGGLTGAAGKTVGRTVLTGIARLFAGPQGAALAIMLLLLLVILLPMVSFIPGNLFTQFSVETAFTPPNAGRGEPLATENSIYIRLQKEVNPSRFVNNSDAYGQVVTYTISLSAPLGDITITSFSNVSQILKESGSSPFPIPDVSNQFLNKVLKQGESLVVTYTVTLPSDSSIDDSLVSDSVTIHAITPEGEQVSYGSASIAIGELPGLICIQYNSRSYCYPLMPAFSVNPSCSHHDYVASDIMTRAGFSSPTVVAFVDGEIITASSGDPIAGTAIIEKGDDGYIYGYYHLASKQVGIGQRVTAGQILGVQGSSGNAQNTSEHTHFQAIAISDCSYSNLSMCGNTYDRTCLNNGGTRGQCLLLENVDNYVCPSSMFQQIFGGVITCGPDTTNVGCPVCYGERTNCPQKPFNPH